MKIKNANKIEDLINNTERFETNTSFGLSSEQILKRQEEKLINTEKKKVTKSYGMIIKDNFVNFFNILLFIIAAFMIYGQYYSSLVFLVVLFLNIAIGLFQDIRARKLVDKLRIVNSPKVLVIRNGQEVEVHSNELVLDDVVVLKAGNQISADSILLKGLIKVDESLLTGESIDVTKKEGDLVFSGTYVKSGSAYVRVNKVGSANYAEQLQMQSKEFRRPKSEILRSITQFFKIFGFFVILCGVLIIICNAVNGTYSDVESFRKSLGTTAGALVAMIPSGMYLLTSLTLALGVIRLAKRKTLVQELYCIEMLARVNILCLDKTGTITDGTMKVKEFEVLNEISENSFKDIIKKYIGINDEDNATGRALKDFFGKQEDVFALSKLDFDSKNKYAAVSFNNEGTYILGAPETIDITNKEQILQKTLHYTKKGYRVLLLAHSKNLINKDKIEGEITPVGFIVLQDHIKDDAKQTIEWFKNNDVQIRIISGDNAYTASEIAKEVGVVNADRLISLEGMSLEEVRNIADQYIVFGRVSPEQKEVIIESLREKENCVAMTGDGVNDILALKRADCSIAMANGAEAARDVSHLVLLDSNFSALPRVVEEGRRVINNLQKTSSLFVVKTFFAIFTTLVFICIGFFNKNVTYPFVTNNLYLWELFTIGLASFFLALQPNKERLKGTFSQNIIRKAVPGSIIIAAAVFLIFGLLLIEYYNTGTTQITSNMTAVTMSVVAMTYLSLVYLFRLCWPFNRYRIILFSSITLLIIISFLIVGLTNIDFLAIDFRTLNTINVIELACICVGLTPIYFGLDYLFNKNL